KRPKMLIIDVEVVQPLPDTSAVGPALEELSYPVCGVGGTDSLCGTASDQARRASLSCSSPARGVKDSFHFQACRLCGNNMSKSFCPLLCELETPICGGVFDS